MADDRKKRPSPVPVVPITPAESPQRWELGTVLAWLFCGYLLVMPLADGILHWSSSAMTPGSELTADRARFSVVNAITLTGFQSGISINTYPLPGKITLLLLTLIGILFSLIAGGLAVVRIVRLPYSDRQVVYGALAITGGAMILGAIPLIEAHRSPLDVLMLSASAFGNGGLFFGDLPRLTTWQTQLVLMPLAVLGGLGLPVLLELVDLVWKRRPLSGYSQLVLWSQAVLYLVGLIVLLGVSWAGLEAPFKSESEAMRFIGSASVLSINSRTAGFPLEYVQDYSRAVPWVVMGLMVIGGASAGTAGGLKLTTLAALIRGTRRAIRGESTGREFGLACLWLAAYFVVAGVMFILLLLSEPQLSETRMLFETISGFSNVGLSFDRIYTVRPGLDVMTVTMLLGRMLPLSMLWWMAAKVKDAELPIG